MKQYEGTMKIKWWKNDSGDYRPLSIYAINHNRLQKELKKIKARFMKFGDDPKYHKVKRENIGAKPYSITFDMSERK